MTPAEKPWRLVKASTRFIRVPTRYWAAVRLGMRREFRFLGRSATVPHTMKAPLLAVAWCYYGSAYQSQLVVIERVWQERLGEISNDSLEAEGHVGPHAMASYRAEWVTRTHRPFRFGQVAWAIRLRPATSVDFAGLAFVHLARLYEEHLDDDIRRDADDRSQVLLAG